MSGLTRKEVEDMARRLDHAAMSAMELENRDLKSRLAEAEAQLEKMRVVMKDLASCDPVYGPVTVYGPRGPLLEEGKKESVRICALCRRRSGHNQENVTHTINCPWLPSKTLVNALAALPKSDKP